MSLFCRPPGLFSSVCKPLLDKVYFNYNISKFIKKTNSRISWKATSKLTKTAGFCKYKYFLDNYGDFDYGIYEIEISKKIIDNIFDNNLLIC